MSAHSDRMRFRWRHVIYGFLGKYLLKLIGYTCHFKIEGMEEFVRFAHNNKCILMLWHSRLAMMGEILTRYAPQLNYAALISDSRDGEMLSYLVDNSGIGRSIRVPHNGRAGALQTLIKEIKKTDDVIIITPDGPRGPACKVKPGIILAAKKTEAQVIPIVWTASRFWKLSTWDGLIIPKPFCTIKVKMGQALKINDTKNDSIEVCSKRLENAIEALGK